MEFETISVERGDRRATITLRREEALNAITPTMLAELERAFADVGGDPDVGAIVLTGAGRAFCSGVDLKSLGVRELAGGKVGDVLDLPARRVIDAIRATPAVVIAKVNGFCFTGALELALACDLVVVAEEAKLGDTHTRWGLRPTWGMSQRLPRAVGPAMARRLSYTAKNFTGAQAAAWGLACEACPRDELDAVVDGLVDEVLRNSRDANAAYKDLYRAAEDRTLADGLRYEAETEFEIRDTDERLGEF